MKNAAKNSIISIHSNCFDFFSSFAGYTGEKEKEDCHCWLLPLNEFEIVVEVSVVLVTQHYPYNHTRILHAHSNVNVARIGCLCVCMLHRNRCKLILAGKHAAFLIFLVSVFLFDERDFYFYCLARGFKEKSHHRCTRRAE